MSRSSKKLGVAFSDFLEREQVAVSRWKKRTTLSVENYSEHFAFL